MSHAHYQAYYENYRTDLSSCCAERIAHVIQQKYYASASCAVRNYGVSDYLAPWGALLSRWRMPLLQVMFV